MRQNQLWNIGGSRLVFILAGWILNVVPGDGREDGREPRFKRARRYLIIVAVADRVVQRRAGGERAADCLKALQRTAAQENAIDNPFAIDAEAQGTAKFALGQERPLQIRDEYVNSGQLVTRNVNVRYLLKPGD